MIQGRNYLLAGKLNYRGATSPKNERIAVLTKIPFRRLYTISIHYIHQLQKIHKFEQHCSKPVVP